MKRKRIRSLAAMPWGFAVAMLTASIVTLVGVFLRLDPDVILLRAALAAAITGLVTRLAVSCLQTFLLHP